MLPLVEIQLLTTFSQMYPESQEPHLIPLQMWLATVPSLARVRPAMGPVIYPERSPPAARSSPSKLSLSESEPDSNSSNFEFSETESTAGENLSNAQAQLLWDEGSLIKFGEVCDRIPNDDSEFDRLNNKLLIALKDFTSENKIYCFKCKSMSLMTKRGKTNKTYQFNCYTHTVSASQILGSLPDTFILQHLPKEPRHIHNQTLSWIGKDQLSPELLERTSSRNAVKRYSTHRSPIKASTSSLLTSRNQVNEVLIEMKQLKIRFCDLERELTASKTTSTLMEEKNTALLEQLKAIKEENALLKKFLSSPKESHEHEPQQKRTTTNPASADTKMISYSNVADIFKPNNRIMRFYTKALSNPRTPIEIVSAPTFQPKAMNTRSSVEFSPLKVLFFKGCHRKSIGDYKKMLPAIGFQPQLARHMIFLTEDILQITTFESKASDLITALESISENVKHLPEFDPTKGSSYESYGDFTDVSASKCYFTLMQKAADKLSNEISRMPSLKRTLHFLKKLIDSRCINFPPAPKPTKIFCLGDFLIKKDDKMDVDQAESHQYVEPTESNIIEASTEATETSSNSMEESPIPNDQ